MFIFISDIPVFSVAICSIINSYFLRQQRIFIRIPQNIPLGLLDFSLLFLHLFENPSQFFISQIVILVLLTLLLNAICKPVRLLRESRIPWVEIMWIE